MVAVFFGLAGAALSAILSSIGAAIGSYKSGTSLAICSSTGSKLGIAGILPLIMAGILNIYGLIVAIFISGNSNYFDNYS